jgi:hypothetical protein
VFEGKANLSFEFKKAGKAAASVGRAACIRTKHDEFYETQPEEFIRQAYFDCIYGLKKRTETIVSRVFGLGHDYLHWLFQKDDDGYSLHEIRGQLAHGGFSLSNAGDEDLVATRLPEIMQIAKQFLTRIIFMLKPEDDLPTWSRRFGEEMHMADPRSTMFATSDKALPSTDWRIRPHWCK